MAVVVIEAVVVDVEMVEDVVEDVAEVTIRTLWLVHIVQILISVQRRGPTIEKSIKLLLDSNRVKFNKLKLQLDGLMATRLHQVLPWIIEDMQLRPHHLCLQSKHTYAKPPLEHFH